MLISLAEHVIAHKDAKLICADHKQKCLKDLKKPEQVLDARNYWILRHRERLQTTLDRVKSISRHVAAPPS